MFDEELWLVLSRVGGFEVSELAHAARAGREPIRHITCASNLNYRRYRRFSGEALCCTQLGRKNGFRKTLAAPSCQACLENARKITEIVAANEKKPASLHEQLSLFS